MHSHNILMPPYNHPFQNKPVPTISISQNFITNPPTHKNNYMPLQITESVIIICLVCINNSSFFGCLLFAHLVTHIMPYYMLILLFFIDVVTNEPHLSFSIFQQFFSYLMLIYNSNMPH
jgi:hypothetical protein